MRRLHFGVAAAYLLVAQMVKAFVAQGFVEESLGQVFVVERASLFEQGHERLLYEVFTYLAALDEVAGEGDEHGIIVPEELGDISPPLRTAEYRDLRAVVCSVLTHGFFVSR